jgi:molecular chaperone GrpE (heat shock protein)
MLKLSLVSKYFILILLAFFLTSCGGEEAEITTTEDASVQTDNSAPNSDSEGNETQDEDGTQDGSSSHTGSSIDDATDNIESSKDIQTESESQIAHWTTLLVIFLVLASLILVIVYSLFDVKHIKGPVFKISRKKLERPKPKSSEQKSNPAMKKKNPEIQIPSSDMEAHIAQQSQNINELKKDLANLLKNIDDMNQTFLTLKDNLDRKDEELARFKDGYDATIFKNFILRFTRVDKVLKESISDQNYTQGALEDIQIQMEDALAECDIKIFSPSVGDDFKSLEGVADNPKQIETSKKNQNLTIAEVIQPGYRRKLPGSGKDNFQIITEAKVAIYIYKDN